MRFNDTLTIWRKSTIDGYGIHSFATPVQISGRWEEKSARYINEAGQENQSRAVVYIDGEVAVTLGDWLFLGTSETANPKSVSGAYPVNAISKIFNLKGTKSLKKLWLGGGK